MWIGSIGAERVRDLPVSVIETRGFSADARRLITEEENAELTMHIALTPRDGDLIPRTGGVRKLRWSLLGKGKRGGARIIYYYHSKSMPIFLLAIYSKNQKISLSHDEKREVKKIVTELVKEYLGTSEWRMIS